MRSNQCLAFLFLPMRLSGVSGLGEHYIHTELRLAKYIMLREASSLHTIIPSSQAIGYKLAAKTPRTVYRL